MTDYSELGASESTFAPEPTWTTEELQRDYTVNSFGFGLCFVTRKADEVSGTLDFRRDPDGVRRYFGFLEDK